MSSNPNEQHADSTSPITQKKVSWLTPGVWSIGLASFLADVGHEVPTALFASLVTITLGAPAAALGLIEGLADGLAGLARFVGLYAPGSTTADHWCWSSTCGEVLWLVVTCSCYTERSFLRLERGRS